MFTHRPFRMAAAGGIILTLVMLGNPWAALAAPGWSPAVVISPSQTSATTNAFAVNSTGNELWVTGSPALGGYAIQAAQRSSGGTWSPQTTIFSVTNGFGSTVPSIYASIGANNTASAAWLVGSSIRIALRTPAGTWQTPVLVAAAGIGSAQLVVKSDAQGNGVAAWSQMLAPATGSVVEAVTWSASGVFSNVVQLSGFGLSQFTPDLAVNEAGTAVVVWSMPTTFGGSLYQVESATRPAGGNWSAATAVSPVLPQASLPRVALDGSGDATALWEQGTTVDAATRPAGGAWGSPALIETSSLVGSDALASDASGNVTAVWAMHDPTSGVTSVRSATRPAGARWGAPASLGACGSTCVPYLTAARDGSITAVAWANSPAVDASVRLGLGTWAPAVVSSSFSQLTNLIAGNNAFASASWTTGIHVKYHVALVESDYR